MSCADASNFKRDSEEIYIEPLIRVSKFSKRVPRQLEDECNLLTEF